MKLAWEHPQVVCNFFKSLSLGERWDKMGDQIFTNQFKVKKSINIFLKKKNKPEKLQFVLKHLQVA